MDVENVELFFLPLFQLEAPVVVLAEQQDDGVYGAVDTFKADIQQGICRQIHLQQWVP